MYKVFGLVLAIQNASIHVRFSFSTTSSLFYSFMSFPRSELPVKSKSDAIGSNMPKAKEQKKL